MSRRGTSTRDECVQMIAELARADRKVARAFVTVTKRMLDGERTTANLDALAALMRAARRAGRAEAAK